MYQLNTCKSILFFVTNSYNNSRNTVIYSFLTVFVSVHRKDTCILYAEIVPVREEVTGGGLHMDVTKNKIDLQVFN